MKKFQSLENRGVHISNPWKLLCLGLVAAWTMSAQAATLYVWTNSPSPAPPYNDWTNAARTIQTAVNAAGEGDLVLVTNGVYDTGTTVTPGGALSNRVFVRMGVTVQSVNGPSNTFIVGAGPRGNAAVRCVFLETNAVLSGFTLMSGFTRTTGSWPLDDSGGGAFCRGSATITNCIIRNNEAQYAGGVMYGTIRDSELVNNEAFYVNDACGGGAYWATLIGCQVVSNRASGGGGTLNCTVRNSVLSYNTAWRNYGGGAHGGTLTGCVIQANWASLNGGGAYNADLYNCEITDNVSSNGGGAGGGASRVVVNCLIARNVAHVYGGGTYSVSVRNSLVLDNVASNAGGGAYWGHLFNVTMVANRAGNYAGTWVAGNSSVTNCIIVENYLLSGPLANWGGTTSMHNSCTIPLPSGSVNCTTNDPLFVDFAGGNYRLSKGSPCINTGTNYDGAEAASDLDGNPRVQDGTVDMGCYERSPIRYVAPGGAAVRPYDNWPNAASVIQNAVDEAADGETVLVSNGVYSSGGALGLESLLTSRVVITSAITVQSVNGPGQTVIEGGPDPVSGGLGSNAVRCAYISSNALLAGFTLRGGRTWAEGGDQNRERGGAGVLLYYGGTVSNCVIEANNAAAGQGGGANLYHGGTLAHCVVRSNTALRGGGFSCEQGRAVNCLIADNLAYHQGGGAFFRNPPSVMEHCTVAANTALTNGGGVYFWAGCTSLNSIIYFNATDDWANLSGDLMLFTCAPGAPAGFGNVTNDPQFISAGDRRLEAGSPCIDAGTNTVGIGSDLDLIPRPLDGNADGTNTADMGCYEFVSALADSDNDTMRDRWEMDHSFDPTDPSDASGDPDADGDSNAREHIADTDPWDDTSYFRLTGVTRASPVSAQFNSSTGRLYTLQGTADLVEGSWSNVPGAGPRMGAGGVDSMTDTNDPPHGPFYRMGVQLP